jgi:hypothetical protein
MKKLILTENQIKKVIDSIINEQQASEFSGGTDSQRMSHALLSKNFGLPEGADHENYYYSANIADVIKMSGSGDRTKFLSVFKYANAYSEDTKNYMDTIYVNKENLTNSGTKTFNFTSGVVYGTHNGLLALVRAMDHMGGTGGYLTISFGGKTSGKEAESQRIGSGVKFDSNRSMSQSSVMNTIEQVLVALSVAPKYREIGNFISIKPDETNENIISLFQKVITNVAIGAYGFMDNSKKEEVIKNLTPKGYITKIDFDIAGFVQKLLPLQNIPDMELDERTGKLKLYNEQKRQTLDSIGDAFEENLVNALKTAYMKNFQMYVENYLPNSVSQIVPMIKNVKFDYKGLGYSHDLIFHSYTVGSSYNKSTLSQKKVNYQTGN